MKIISLSDVPKFSKPLGSYINHKRNRDKNSCSTLTAFAKSSCDTRLVQFEENVEHPHLMPLIKSVREHRHHEIVSKGRVIRRRNGRNGKRSAFTLFVIQCKFSSPWDDGRFQLIKIRRGYIATGQIMQKKKSAVEERNEKRVSRNKSEVLEKKRADHTSSSFHNEGKP